MKINRNNCRFLTEEGKQCTNRVEPPMLLCSDHGRECKDAPDLRLEIFKVVVDHLKQDVREFWPRSNFYLLVQAGLLSVFATLASGDYLPEKSLVISIVGLIVAVFWSLAARGAVLWIRKWRAAVMEIDEEVNPYKTYSKTESFAYSNPLMSPSNVTQFLPWVFVLAWCTILIYVLFKL